MPKKYPKCLDRAPHQRADAVWCHSSASKVALVLHAMCDDNKTCRFLR